MKIAVIPGDGIGKEVTAEAVKVLEAVCDVSGKSIELETLPWGADYYLATGITIPPNGHDMLRDEFDAILLGALGDPRVPDNRTARDILLSTRFALDLFINFRPVRLIDDRLSPLKNRGTKDINFVVFRENTEGVYVGVGGRFKAGTTDEITIQEEINTYKGVHRIIRQRLRVRERARPDEGLHGRQEQRDAATATRCGSACSRKSRSSFRRSRRRTSTSTRSRCFSSAILASSR